MYIYIYTHIYMYIYIATLVKATNISNVRILENIKNGI